MIPAAQDDMIDAIGSEMDRLQRGTGQTDSGTAPPASEPNSGALYAAQWIAALFAGLGVLVLIWPMVETAGNTAAHVQDVLTDLTPKQVAHETLDLLINSNSVYWQWVTIGIAVVGAPLLEETMYRGMLQEGLKHIFAARWPAIFVTSVIFTALHLGAVEPHALAALFVLSLGFGWLYEKTGSIIAPMVMHGAFNVANILLTLLLVNLNATL